MALVGGFDTIYCSSQARISAEVRAKLTEEKARAQLAAKVGAVHCPDWLGARVFPNGARGYSFLIETEDFTVKITGEHMTAWPGVALELRSHFLHAHPEGPRGACEEALCWIREQLLYDLDPFAVQTTCTFETVTPSRIDLHVDWQRGFVPMFAAGEAEHFIKPRRVKWHPYFEGNTCTGYRFGEGGSVVARLYNKTTQCKNKHDEWFPALVAAVAANHGDAFDPERDLWRLEFQLRREGVKGFKLYEESDASDDPLDPAGLDADIEAELAAEDLPHVGTLPKLFTYQAQIWEHLTTHWLRLVVPANGKVRSRWPLDPTWEVLRSAYSRLAQMPPLDEQTRQLVRSARNSGKSRLLRRMAIGVVNSLEVEDASVASATLHALQQQAERIAQKEEERAEMRRARYLAAYGHVPQWVERGMGARLERARQVKHRTQMLLGIFAAHGVLPLELKPATTVADLLIQHINELEQEAEEKGGIPWVLADHFAKVYKVAAFQALIAPQDGAVSLSRSSRSKQHD